MCAGLGAMPPVAALGGGIPTVLSTPLEVEASVAMIVMGGGDTPNPSIGLAGEGGGQCQHSWWTCCHRPTRSLPPERKVSMWKRVCPQSQASWQPKYNGVPMLTLKSSSLSSGHPRGRRTSLCRRPKPSGPARSRIYLRGCSATGCLWVSWHHCTPRGIQSSWPTKQPLFVPASTMQAWRGYGTTLPFIVKPHSLGSSSGQQSTPRYIPSTLQGQPAHLPSANSVLPQHTPPRSVPSRGATTQEFGIVSGPLRGQSCRWLPGLYYCQCSRAGCRTNSV